MCDVLINILINIYDSSTVRPREEMVTDGYIITPTGFPGESGRPTGSVNTEGEVGQRSIMTSKGSGERTMDLMTLSEYWGHNNANLRRGGSCDSDQDVKVLVPKYVNLLIQRGGVCPTSTSRNQTVSVRKCRTGVG